jgi:hypothetical protein
MCMVHQKFRLFLIAAVVLLMADLACTYETFVILGLPLSYEMNPVFRSWMIQDGWALSFLKFSVLKTLLFFFCGWLIFYTRNWIFTYIFAQLVVTNHLVAIFSHSTLWWIHNWELRSCLLMAAGISTLIVTFMGLRYLRSEGPLFINPPLAKAHQ